MDKQFEIGYSYKTFGGIIGAGVLTVAANDIVDVKKEAFAIVIKSLKDQHDEESDYSWNDDYQNLQCSVTEVKENA